MSRSRRTRASTRRPLESDRSSHGGTGRRRARRCRGAAGPGAGFTTGRPWLRFAPTSTSATSRARPRTRIRSSPAIDASWPRVADSRPPGRVHPASPLGRPDVLAFVRRGSGPEVLVVTAFAADGARVRVPGTRGPRWRARRRHPSRSPRRARGRRPDGPAGRRRHRGRRRGAVSGACYHARGASRSSGRPPRAARVPEEARQRRRHLPPRRRRRAASPASRCPKRSSPRITS